MMGPDGRGPHFNNPQEVRCCKACNNSSISSSNSKVPKEEDPEEDPRVFEGLVEKVREEV